jgi:hypothetical protein
MRCTPVRYTPMRLLQTVVAVVDLSRSDLQKKVFALVAGWSLGRAARVAGGAALFPFRLSSGKPVIFLLWLML